MKTESWPKAIWKRLFGHTADRSRAAEFPRFYDRKLERRRVLDAGPLGLGATAFDAGSLADDQQHDQFEVAVSFRQNEGEAGVSVNGEALGEASGTVRINGSSDHDTLVIDHVESESTTDLSVNYQWLNDTTLEVSFDDHDSATEDLTLIVSNVEQVIDRLNASERSFAAGTATNLHLSDDAVANNGYSQLQSDLGTTIQFASPSGQLTLHSADDTASNVTAWRISGSDQSLTANIRLVGDSADSISFEESFQTSGASLVGHAGAIDVAGSISTSGGDLLLVANDLNVGSSATLNVGSGNIELHASEINFAGEAIASGESLVRIDAGESGSVEIAGTIEALGSKAGDTGGVVAISGREVLLHEGTTIDVSGQAGGGAILIGGGLRGESEIIRSAEQTTVANGVQLFANAIETGNGGIVAVWADGFTSYHGRIEARGGAVAGNGGLAEVSGRESLLYAGFVALDAPNGQHGSLVLDPATITVVQDTPGTDEIETATIEAANMDFTIMADANVIFEDLDSMGTGGDTITLMNNVSLSVLTVNANGDPGSITFQNPSNDLDSIVASGSGNLIFQAGTDGTDPEEVDIVGVGNLTTAAGNVELRATDDISVLGDITTNSGNITVNADTNLAGTGTVSIGSAVTTTSGNVQISGTSLNLDRIGVNAGTGNIDLVGNAIDFSNAASSLSGSGTLTIRPNATGTAINIGDAGFSALSLIANEIANLQNGFSSITIGDSTAGTGAVEINNATFTDNLSIHGGSIQVRELSAGSDNVTLNARTGNLTARNNVAAVDVTGGSVTLMAGGDIGQAAGNGPLQVSATTLTTDTSGSSGSQYISQSGSVAVSSMAAGTGSIELETGVYVVGSAATISASALSIQSGADLAGSGTVNANVTITGSNAMLTPGDGDTDRLTIGGTLDLQSNTTLAITLNSTTAATGYDQVRVSGDVTLAGALSLTKGFTASLGDTFTIVELTGGASSVTGTFAGLSEGEVFAVNDQFAQITYQGGSGNDVMLTMVASVFSISADQTSLNEGNSGTTEFDFTVTRSGDTVGTSTLTYTVTGSGANAAEAGDFDGGSFPTGSVMFADGESTATITVTVARDTIVEGDEGFTVTLSNQPAGDTIDTAAASSTITNDDTATITFSGETVNEETGNLEYTITLSNEVDVDITVEFDTLTSGSATVVDDFTAITNQTVTFTAGATSQTVSVTVVDDDIVEGNETVVGQVNTLNANSRDVQFTGMAASLNATGMITNQDAAVVTLTGGTANENAGPLVFTVSLDNEVDQDITVDFDTRTTGTAESNDFTSITDQSVTISAGTLSATVSVSLTGDTIVELDERVDARVNSLNNNSRNVMLFGGGSETTGSGTITNDDMAIVSLSGATVDENSGPLQFTITLSNEVDADVTVDFSTLLSGTAGAGDFTGITSQTVTFTAGDVSETVNVTLTGDTVVELDETLAGQLDMLDDNGRAVTLSGGGASFTANGTISNDDTATITFSGETVNEETGTLDYTITLSNEVDVDVTVEFDTLTGGTATVVDDFTAIADQVVTISAGMTSATVSVTIIDDDIVEGTESLESQVNTLSANGRNVQFAGMAASLNANGMITNQDAAVVTLTGGTADENAGPLVFTVSLDNLVDQDITVDFDTRTTGTAESNDFTSITDQSVTISAGTLSATVSVTLTGDTIVELDERVDARVNSLNMNGRNVTLSGGGSETTGSGTITNDDMAIVSLSGATVDENSGPLQFTITLSNEVDADVTVDFSTLLSGTAGAADFTGIASQTVTFTAGDVSETVNVTLTGDTIVELDETLAGQIDMLANNGRAVTLSGGGGTFTANGTISNDDTATITFAGETIDEESGDPLFTVTLSNAIDVDITVEFDTLGTGTATVVDDYAAASNQVVTIMAGSTTQSITVAVVDDDIVESDETIDGEINTLTTSGRSVTFAGMATSLMATGTITNQDVVTVTLTGGSAAENSGTLQFTVTLSNAVDVDVSVEFDTLLSGTAIANDFTAVANQMVTITAGMLSNTVDVTLTADAIVELDETIVGQIDMLNNGGRNVVLTGLGSSTTGTGTITNDDSAVITLTGGTAAENGGPLQYTATLSNEVDATVTVDFSTLLSGTAGAGDFTGISGQAVTFVAGDLVETVNVTLTDDNVVEIDETLTAQLDMLAANGRSVTLSGGGASHTADGTITNDDSATIELLDVSASEATGQLDFTVQLSNLVDANVSVNFQTLVTGTATPVADFAVVAGSTVTVNALQSTATFTVTVVDDNIVESDETVNATIDTLNSMGRNVTFVGGGTANTAVGTILEDDMQTLTIDDTSASEAVGVITYQITLGAQADAAIDVTFDTLLTGTATSGTDFTPLTSFMVSFAAGETSKTVDVTVLDDQIVELDETINARVRATVQGSNLEDFGTGTIQDDDQATITIAGVTVTEGSAGTINADFVVTLSHDVDAAVDFNSATADGTATSADGDYVAQASTMRSFAASSGAGATQTISVAVQGDSLVELNETFLLTLSGLSSGGRNVILSGGGGTLDGTGTINNDDAAVISIAGVTANESTGQLQFQLTLTNPVDAAVTVDFDTLLTGTATAGVDFTSVANQTISFAANTTSTTATVTVINENLVEADETVATMIDTIVDAGRAVGIGQATATGTITNDDSAEITITAATATEGGGPLVYTVTLSNPVDTAVTIQFDTLTTGTATAGIDFTAIADLAVTFAASDLSETISVTIIDDNVVEGDETIVGEVNTLTPVARAVSFSGSGASTSATGTISSNDTATLTIGDVTQSEGTGGTTNFTFTVTLSNDVEGGFDAPFTINDGTATDADDFDAVTVSPLTFAGTSMETQSVVVSVLGDAKVEIDEAFTVALDALQSIDAVASAAITLSGPATGQINNDDATILSVVAIGASSVSEGDTGTTDLMFEIRLSNPTDLAVTTTATTADGVTPGSNAVAGDDYVALNQAITFNAGASGTDLIQTVTVTVNTDARFELDEVLSLNLSNSLINGAIDATRLLTGAGTAFGSILNDDTDIIETGGGNDDRLELTTTGADAGSFVLTIDGVAGTTIPFTGITSVTFNGDYIGHVQRARRQRPTHNQSK